MYVEQPFNIFRRVVYALKIPHYVRAIKTSSDVVLTQLLRAVTYFFEKCCVGKKRIVASGFVAQVEKSRYDPYPRRSYATAGTATVVGHPSCVNRLSKATRTCNSVT